MATEHQNERGQTALKLVCSMLHLAQKTRKRRCTCKTFSTWICNPEQECQWHKLAKGQRNVTRRIYGNSASFKISSSRIQDAV